MKTSKRKIITAYTLSNKIVSKIENLHSKTLLSRSKIIELFVEFNDLKSLKRLIKRKTDLIK